MSTLALEHPGVANSVAFPGLSINGFVNAPNTGIAFVTLKPSHERARMHDMDANHIVGALNQRFASIQEAFVGIFPPPPVQGLGQVGGFKLYVEDRGRARVRGALSPGAAGDRRRAAGAVAGRAVLELSGQRAADRRARRSRAREDLRHSARPTCSTRCRSTWARSTSNDFNRFGRTYQVNVQAESSFRMQPEQIARLKTRNAKGEMVPLGSRAARRPDLRARSGDALQRLPGGRDQRRSGAGPQLGTGAGRHRRAARSARCRTA